jgi:hypothetical protein
MDVPKKCWRQDCPNPVAHAEQIDDNTVFFYVGCVRWGVDRYRPGYLGHAAICPDVCHRLLVEHGFTPTEQCLDCAQAGVDSVRQDAGKPYAGSFTRREIDGTVIEWCCQKMATTDLTRAIRESGRRP